MPLCLAATGSEIRYRIVTFLTQAMDEWRKHTINMNISTKVLDRYNLRDLCDLFYFEGRHIQASKCMIPPSRI